MEQPKHWSTVVHGNGGAPPVPPLFTRLQGSPLSSWGQGVSRMHCSWFCVRLTWGQKLLQLLGSIPHSTVLSWQTVEQSSVAPPPVPPTPPSVGGPPFVLPPQATSVAIPKAHPRLRVICLAG